MVGITAVLGGNLTLVGASSNVLAQGILLEAGCRGMHFFEPALVGLPIFLAVMLAYFFFLYRMQDKVFRFEELQSSLKEKTASYEFSKLKFCTTMGILGLCILGFIFEITNFGAIALLGACLLVITRCVDFKETLRGLDWNTLIILKSVVNRF